VIQLRFDGGEALPIVLAGACVRCACPSATDLADGSPCPSCVAELARSWSAGGAWSAATRRSYATAVASWVAWCSVRGIDPAGIEPGRIDPELAAWVAWSAATGGAYSTVRMRLYGVVSSIRSRSPGVVLDLRPARQALRQLRLKCSSSRGRAPILRADLAAAVDALRGSDLDPLVIARDVALLLVGWSVAARPSELAALTWSDLRADAGIIVADVPRVKTGERTPLPLLKSRDRRLDPIGAVETWRELAQVPIVGDRWRGGPVFVAIRAGRLGAGLSAEGVSDRVALALGRVGLARSGHGLRAGLVTEAIAAGVSVSEIRAITGHSDVGSLDRYVHLAELRDNRATRLL
jgi:integrase